MGYICCKIAKVGWNGIREWHLADLHDMKYEINRKIVDKYYKPQHLMVFRNETKISRKGKFSERDWQSGFAGSAGL